LKWATTHQTYAAFGRESFNLDVGSGLDQTLFIKKMKKNKKIKLKILEGFPASINRFTHNNISSDKRSDGTQTRTANLFLRSLCFRGKFIALMWPR